MMKFFKWKIFLITSVVCLLPIIFGLYFWGRLPEIIPIHFNIYGEPDNYASKAFVVFGLPVLMMFFQLFCCASVDYESSNDVESEKFKTVTKWIIPCLTAVLYTITIGYAMGWEIDITRTVCIVMGILFIVLGYYLPKSTYVKNFNNLDIEKAKKINKFTGFGILVMGILFLIGAFFVPIGPIICLLLLIPYTIATVIYSIIVSKK